MGVLGGADIRTFPCKSLKKLTRGTIPNLLRGRFIGKMKSDVLFKMVGVGTATGKKSEISFLVWKPIICSHVYHSMVS